MSRFYHAVFALWTLLLHKDVICLEKQSHDLSQEIHNYVLGNLTVPAVCIGRGALTLEQDAAPEAKRRMKDRMLQSLHTVKTNGVTNPGEERMEGDDGGE